MGSGAAVSLLTLLAMARVWNRAFWRSPKDAEFPDPVLMATASVRTSTNASTQATGRSARKDAGKDGVALLPGMMVGSTAALVAFGLALTVFAGPLFQLC